VADRAPPLSLARHSPSKTGVGRPDGARLAAAICYGAEVGGECKVTRAIARLATVSVMALTLALAACGRKGGLDLPPNAAVAQPGPAAAAVPGQAPAVAAPYETDPEGRPLAPNGQKKRLPIDVLLD